MKLNYKYGFAGLLLLAFATTQAQNVTPMKEGAATLAQPMARRDSNALTETFFSALSARSTENYSKAAELFNKVLAMDPNNDASMFELAKIDKQKDNYTEAQALLE